MALLVLQTYRSFKVPNACPKMELLYILLVLLVITRVCGEIAERLKQPALAGELSAGILLGIGVNQFSGSLPVLATLTENEVFSAITDLAIFFLMLYAGIELKPKKLARAGQGAFLIALGGFLVPLVSGFALGWVVLPDSDLKVVQALFLGTALAITAVPVAIKILIDLNALESEPGQVIVSAALFDDVLSLVLLAVLIAMIQTGSLPGSYEIITLLGSIALFFAVTVSVGLVIIPRISRYIGEAKVAEFELSALLVVALGYSLLAEMLGLHFILGAFMAGLFFSRRVLEPRIYEETKQKVSGITMGFLAPVFFASIGLHFQTEAVVEVPLFLILLITIAVLGKLVGAGVVAWLYGMSRQDASAVGVAMSGRGAVELIIADIALRHGLFQMPEHPPPVVANMFSAIVVMAIVTTLLTPMLLRRLLASRHGVDDANIENRKKVEG
jgi:Na+:H+ antiporter